MAGADAGKIDDLIPRLASALVLIPLALAAAFAGGPWLAAAAGAAALAMSYEWARMSEPGALRGAFAFALAGALGAVMLASHGRPLLGLGCAALLGALSALRRKTPVGVAETFGGVLYIGAPGVAILWLRAHPGFGLEIVVAAFAIIWAGDVAAYFGGRLIGGAPIAPRISPQKTRTGVAAAVAAGAAAGIGCGLAFAGPLAGWAIAGMALAAIGMAGDLFESALKRRFNVKDASRLIPGHGGVLDRLDSLMAALVAAALFAALAPGAAAQLFGAP